MSLENLYERYRIEFSDHPLSLERNFVPGVGNADSPPLMFIGEAPGANEDKKGMPFVGRAGSILEQMLDELRVARHQVFVTNAVKYRPVEENGGRLRNRPPTAQEVLKSRPYLVREVSLVKPVIVVPLGTHSLQAVLPGKGSIGRWHGQLLRQSSAMGGRPVFPLFHPMYLGYNPSSRATMWADLARLRDILPAQEGE